MKLTVSYHAASQLPPFAEGSAAFIRRNRSGCSGIWLRRHHLRQKIVFSLRTAFKTKLGRRDLRDSRWIIIAGGR